MFFVQETLVEIVQYFLGSGPGGPVPQHAGKGTQVLAHRGGYEGFAPAGVPLMTC